MDLSAKLLLDAVEVEAILPVDKVNSQTKMSETTRTTDTMKICLCVLGEVEVDNNVNSLDVDTTSEQIRTHQVSADTITEVMEDAVTVVLEHARVRVEARVS